ncbi:MAG: hypothetical protein ABI954_06955 [Pyrinomonadaceae bacterium]
MMKTIILALFLALFVFGQPTGTLAQSPDKILKKAVKALGGEKALRSVSSRQVVGRITRLEDGATGNYQMSTSNPNLYTQSFDLNGFETASGYNGKSAWTLDSRNGLQTLTGTAGRDFQAEAGYRNALWLNYKKDKVKVVYDGQSSLNGKKVDSVILANAKNSKIKIYFDSASGLPLREEITTGDSIKLFDYSNYRNVDGVREPFTVALTIENQQYAVKLDQIIHNRQIENAVFDFPRLSDAPLPDITALLKQVEANEEKVDEILENYTYTETQASREVGANGVLQEKEVVKHQVNFYRGYQIRRLISKNGKSLSPDENKNQEKKAADSITEIDNKVAKRDARAAATVEHSAKEQVGTSGARISIGEILRASKFVNPRRERFLNRDVIVFDFEPNPDFDDSNAKSLLKFFGKTAGAIWIDEQDKQVARVEAVLVENFNVAGGLVAKLKKGASFTLEQNRINDEIWLPSSADINLSVKVLLVKGININQLVRYRDYQKFKSEVKDAKVDAPNNP